MSSVTKVSEMLELCEKKYILAPYDGIELVGTGGTVVKDAKTPYTPRSRMR